MGSATRKHVRRWRRWRRRPQDAGEDDDEAIEEEADGDG